MYWERSWLHIAQITHAENAVGQPICTNDSKMYYLWTKNGVRAKNHCFETTNQSPRQTKKDITQFSATKCRSPAIGPSSKKIAKFLSDFESISDGRLSRLKNANNWIELSPADAKTAPSAPPRAGLSVQESENQEIEKAFFERSMNRTQTVCAAPIAFTPEKNGFLRLLPWIPQTKRYNQARCIPNTTFGRLYQFFWRGHSYLSVRCEGGEIPSQHRKERFFKCL